MRRRAALNMRNASGSSTISADATLTQSGEPADYPGGALPPLWKLPLFGIRPDAAEATSRNGGDHARSG